MEPEREKPGGFPPTTEQKPYFVHTAVLTGIAVFFLFDRLFFFSPGLTHHPADHRAAAAWALAFAKAAGMCLMIGYSVFKVPGEAKKEPLTLFAAE